jgi:transcriptional regulator with XRE-family HTH domain
MGKFAERLKSLRAEKNLTQKELAQALGFSSRSTISNYEKNSREPDIYLKLGFLYK